MSGARPTWATLTDWLLAYRSGDAAKARPLFEALTPVLRRYFLVRTGSREDADDLTQACLLKLHFARDRYDAEKALKTWVFTVASRCLIDHWRGGRAAAGRVDEDPGEAPAGALPVDVKLEYSEELAAALGQLKPVDRTIVYLYGVEELSMAEIARTVGLSEGATKVRAHRSYVKLRQLLGEGSQA